MKTQIIVLERAERGLIAMEVVYPFKKKEAM
jgi:hypothetical protein